MILIKKILLIIVFALTMYSCKKEKCYYCTFTTFNGGTPPPVTYCGDDGGTRQFQDAAGNDLGRSCAEIK